MLTESDIDTRIEKPVPFRVSNRVSARGWQDNTLLLKHFVHMLKAATGHA